MTDTPVAAPAAPAPVDELAVLKAQIAELQAKVAAPPVAPPVSPETHGPVKLVGMAAVSAWFKGVRAAVAAKNAAGVLYDVLSGLKTLLVFGVTGGLALLSEFETIDLTPLLSKFLPEGGKLDAAGAIVLMSVVGVLLRLVTKSGVFRRAQTQVARPGATDSKVDDPDNG